MSPAPAPSPEGYFEALLVFTDGTSETVNVDKLGGKSIKGTTDTSEGQLRRSERFHRQRICRQKQCP